MQRVSNLRAEWMFSLTFTLHEFFNARAGIFLGLLGVHEFLPLQKTGVIYAFLFYSRQIRERTQMLVTISDKEKPGNNILLVSYQPLGQQLRKDVSLGNIPGARLAANVTLPFSTQSVLKNAQKYQ